MGRVTGPFFRRAKTIAGEVTRADVPNSPERPAVSMKPHVVRPKARQLIEQTWQSQANLSVFLCLLVISVFVLPALREKQLHIVFYTDAVATLLLIAGVAIGWGRRRLFVAGVLAAIPALIVRWVALFVASPVMRVWVATLTLVAVLVIGYILLAQVFRDGPINAVRVQGAVAAYLLLGVGYADAYEISAYFDTKAITSTVGPMNSFVDWIYFSFSTLSTLGYGDIIPTGQASRMLAIGEAISGQLFLAILIARLVAMQVNGGGERHSG